MKTNIPSATIFFILALTTATKAVSFNFAYVGNAGNAADPETGFGAVSYDYQISKTEVTNAQYAEFLNAVDPTGANALGLYDDIMARFFPSIDNTGVTDGARYVAIAGSEMQPVRWVSWYDSVRFVNWLHNGQGSGDTESGAYTLLGDSETPTNGLTVVRNRGARYRLPSEDEWYKAAFHDKSAGTAGVYFEYANGSDTVPVSDHPSDNSSAANYRYDDGIANGFNDGFAVSGSSDAGSTVHTDVGAYRTAVSPYGTFDQNGNVLEWTEEVFFTSSRVVRGGAFFSSPRNMSSSMRNWDYDASRGANEVGIRVVTIPEPSAALLGLVASVGALVWRVH